MMRIIELFGVIVVIVGLTCCLASVGVEPKDDAQAAVAGDVNQSNGHIRVPTTFDFTNYIRSFGKAYSFREAAAKSKLFIGRTLQIFQHNVMYMKRKVNYYLGQNEFTDLTPQEISDKYYIGQGIEFEANLSPHSSYSSVSSNESREGYSMATLEDIMSSDQTSEKKAKSIGLDFSSDRGSVENVHLIMDQLKTSPQLAAIMADVVNLGASKRPEEPVKTPGRSSIRHMPVVASNNVNYKPRMTTSYGFFDNWRPPMENFAKHPLEYGKDPSPAEQPVAKLNDKQLKKLDMDELEEAIGEAILSGVLSSIKSIFDHLSYLDPPDDDEDSHDTPTNKNPEAGARYDIDWRASGCISRPKSQSSCNSCYAFAVLGLMEYFYCKQMKKSTDFSAQYVIDCGSKTQLNGCRGGKIKNVGFFINKYGIELNTIYPYTGFESKCPFDDELAKGTGYLRPLITKWQLFSDVDVWHKWLSKSPILVGINMPSDFLAYAGGVHSGSNCDPTKTHAMLLVGSGSEKGEEFWLLKNSYSEFWGEGGYFKLAKNAPSACFHSAIVARVNFLVKTH